MSSHLKVNEHCQEAYRKANRMLGLVKRTIEYRDPLVLVSLYKSLVRPHLEYCSPVWSPHFQKDKTCLSEIGLLQDLCMMLPLPTTDHSCSIASQRFYYRGALPCIWR